VLERAAQRVARVARERRAIRHPHVAEHARDKRTRSPGQDLEGAGIGMGDHVALGQPCPALERGAIEAHPFLQRRLQLADRDREALQLAQHVHEPEPHEAHAALLDRPHHVLAVRFE
jgi:hypothetical protein